MFTLTIETDNAAFEELGEELARILRTAADRVEGLGDPDRGDSGVVVDVNGNTVGRWELG